MALSVPTLLLVSGAFAGGVVATQVLPRMLADQDVPTVTTSAQASEPKAPELVTAAAEAPKAIDCTAVGWPYVKPGCVDAAGDQPARQIRIISTDRNAPRQVPIPAPIKSADAKPAEAGPAGAAEADTSITLAALSDTAAPQVLMNAPLPPPSPVSRVENAAAQPAGTAQADAAQAEAVKADAIAKAKATKAAAEAAARRRIARAERLQRERARIQEARRAEDEPAQADIVVRTGPFEDASGRRYILRPAAEVEPGRRWVSAENVAPPPEFAPRRQPEGLFGWLGRPN